jgi:Uma2 family endonuclease
MSSARFGSISTKTDQGNKNRIGETLLVAEFDCREKTFGSMPMMGKANTRLNYDDYILLPEDKLYEVLDGDLYRVPAPSIRHQRALRNLEFALIQHVKTRNPGELFHSPCEVILSDKNIVQPDILFVRKNRIGIIGELNLRGAPDLVIEILSNAMRKKNLRAKRKIYAGFRIQEYWIVDLRIDCIEVLIWSEIGYISGGIYGKRDKFHSPLLPGLGLLPLKVFSE